MQKTPNFFSANKVRILGDCLRFTVVVVPGAVYFPSGSAVFSRVVVLHTCHQFSTNPSGVEYFGGSKEDS